MNHHASIAIELLVILITAVLSSGLMLLLINTGILQVKSTNGASILDTEFIPFTREGYLAVQEFEFCESIDEQYQCVEPTTTFRKGQPVHFRFIVESSTVNSLVQIVENYRVLGPSGEVLLEVDENSDYNFELQSGKVTEKVYFKDYFTVGYDLPAGEYTLELVLENPLLGKKTKLVKEVGVS